MISTFKYIAASGAVVAYAGAAKEISTLAVRAAGKIADPEKDRKEWAISMVASALCVGAGMAMRKVAPAVSVGAAGVGAVGFVKSVMDMFEDVNGLLDPRASYFAIVGGDWRTLATSGPPR